MPNLPCINLFYELYSIRNRGAITTAILLCIYYFYSFCEILSLQYIDIKKKNYDNYFIHLRDALLSEIMTLNKQTKSINVRVCDTWRNMCGEVEEWELVEDNQQIKKKNYHKEAIWYKTTTRARGEGNNGGLGYKIEVVLRVSLFNHLVVWYTLGEKRGICTNFKSWNT